jgi:hypothetical protein
MSHSHGRVHHHPGDDPDGGSKRRGNQVHSESDSDSDNERSHHHDDHSDIHHHHQTVQTAKGANVALNVFDKGLPPDNNAHYHLVRLQHKGVWENFKVKHKGKAHEHRDEPAGTALAELVNGTPIEQQEEPIVLIREAPSQAETGDVNLQQREGMPAPSAPNIPGGPGGPNNVDQPGAPSFAQGRGAGAPSFYNEQQRQRQWQLPANQQQQYLRMQAEQEEEQAPTSCFSLCCC